LKYHKVKRYNKRRKAMKKRKRLESSKIVYFIFVGIVIGELIASIFSVIFANSSDTREAGLSNIFLSVLAIVLFSVPWLIESRFKLDIPNYLEILVLSFLFASIVLGNIHNFLVDVQGYDKLLHTVSGITISVIAFEIIHFINLSKPMEARMNPVMTAVFAFTFSVTLLVLWEFYEFFIDTLSYNINNETLRNMQRYQWDNTSTIFPQDYGLVDTMLDLIVGTVGAILVSVSGGFWLYSKEKKRLKKEA